MKKIAMMVKSRSHRDIETGSRTILSPGAANCQGPTNPLGSTRFDVAAKPKSGVASNRLLAHWVAQCALKFDPNLLVGVV